MSIQEKLEIVFNFDTTGSMNPCLLQVRQNVEETITKLFKEIPNLKIGIGANGDYCDRNSSYVTKTINLTSNIYDLTHFVRTVSRTGGGDAAEAYELVLHEAQTVYDWSLNSRKIFVLIADDVPHGTSYPLNTLKLDWKNEAKKLADLGVQIYTIQCLSKSYATSFYRDVADIGNGYHLHLDQFTDINVLINAIIYRQISQERVKQYEEQIFTQGKLNRTLDRSFGILMDRPRDSKGRFVKLDDSLASDLKPVPAGRFQILKVDRDCEIRDFVQRNDLCFQPGKGFYEFTKSEEIRPAREVVLVDRKTGDMYSGAKARDMLGVPLGTMKTLSPRTMKAIPYDIFIQSTSYNRKLKADTKFLYEVDLAA
jgi:hypothetical protein